VAIGPGDVLPTEPPISYDGIRLIIVTWGDIERVKHTLHGFYGFNPAASPPFSGETYF